MIVGIQGTRGFSSYQIFLMSMRSVLDSVSESGDDELILYSVGPSNVNSMAMEFSGVSTQSLKSYGVKLKYFPKPLSWLEDNIGELDYFVYLSQPGERTSKLVEIAEDNNIDVGIYRY